MTRDEARRHMAHMCDVFPLDPHQSDHIGVIDRMDLRYGARVAGHPQYPALWFRYSALTTSCQIAD